MLISIRRRYDIQMVRHLIDRFTSGQGAAELEEELLRGCVVGRQTLLVFYMTAGHEESSSKPRVSEHPGRLTEE